MSRLSTVADWPPKGTQKTQHDSGSVLTDEQREALDAALTKKRSEKETMPVLNGIPPALNKPHLGKNVHNEGVKTKRDLAHDHHLSRRGKGSGRTKKSGAGGRFTWGAATDPKLSQAAQDYATTTDRGDPNWDSEEEEEAKGLVSFAEDRITQIAAYKSAVSAILQEFFNAGDISEASLRLQELDHPDFGHYFIKKAIVAALDRHEREREMVSVLLSSLYNEVILPSEMRKGFYDLIDSLEDLQLDVPDAVELTASFACRAIADDVLPPAFIHNLRGSNAVQMAFRRCAESHLADQHFAERMSRVWGHGAGGQLVETKASMSSMLTEYQSSGDIAEVRRLLHDLAVPFFHHELVKQALVLGATGPSSMDKVIILLRGLSSSGDISTLQMAKGFHRVADSLQDIELDNPGASTLFSKASMTAVQEGWIEEDNSSNSQFVSFSEQNSKAEAASNAFRTVSAFKLAAKDIAAEYFESGDIQEVRQRLEELQDPGFHNVFVKHIITMSMDRKDRERELTSCLLSELCANGVIPPDQAGLGFTRLLVGADDLALDVPNAAEMLTLFLGRAIVDEVLPPKFLVDVVETKLPAEGLGLGIVQSVGAMLSARHAAERFVTAWHSSHGKTSELAGRVASLLDEFLVSRDKVEAVRCLRDLGAPHFHHELVYQGIIAALDDPEKKGRVVMDLFRLLGESGEVSSTQMRVGFDRAKGGMEDLSLDYVKAPELLIQWERQAIEAGWLHDELVC
jgi:hypothetical protein